MTGIVVTLKDFHAWLVDELGGFWRDLRMKSVPTFAVTVGTTGELFPALVQFNAKDEPLVAQSPSELDKALRSRSRKVGPHCRLILAEGRHIMRDLADVRLPASQAKRMALIDIAMNTPFQAESVFLTFPDRSELNTGTAYCILKKAELQPVLKVVRESGCSVEEILLQKEGASLTLDRNSVLDLYPPNFSGRLKQSLVAGCIILLALGPIALFTAASHRLDIADEALGSKVLVAQSAVKLARTRLERQTRLHEQMTSLRAQKQISESVVYLWEQTSLILPDNTWLSDFNLEGDTLTLSGFSTSAAAIVPLLEQSEHFDNPRFTSSVNRVPGQNFERFTLQTYVGQAGPES